MALRYFPMARSVFPHATVIDYPSEDGQPVAESDFQLNPLIYAVEALKMHFQDRQDVYVAGNLFIYYEEGNPQAVVAPDVFVVVGAPKHDRSSYMLWREPKAPDVVLEITSRRTRSEDQGAKRGIYAFLGVQEYWQYDPTGDYLVPPLQGSRLVGRNYQPLPATTLSDGTLTLHSDVLGLDLWLEHGRLRLYDPATGQKLLTYQEVELARQQAELARQQAELARQQAELARQHAEERERQEASARQAAQARIAELEAQLRALQAVRPAPPLPSTDPPS
jgi:Uma2 family endonuclease